MAVGIYIPEKLPHPPIALPVLLIVEEALRTAWELMRKNRGPRFNIERADEREVTLELFRTLKNEVLQKGLVPGFDRQVLGDVVRGTEFESFDEQSIEKRPDLAIIFAVHSRPPVFLPHQDALFIECKPIDRSHPVGGHYCDKGIRRFVVGEYAWAMRSAIMLGYARSGYTIKPKLVCALRTRRKALKVIGGVRTCAHTSECDRAERVHVTEHSRQFPYSQTGKAAPPIALRHLWLRRV